MKRFIITLVVSLFTAGAAHAADVIKPAPAFTKQQLTALPQEAWITNGGNLYNQRFSPLDRINRGNVRSAAR